MALMATHRSCGKLLPGLPDISFQKPVTTLSNNMILPSFRPLHMSSKMTRATDHYSVKLGSLDSGYDNVRMLTKLGAFVIHKVDARTMIYHHFLANRKFDRIVYNFPHAGFLGKEDDPAVISMHQKLVLGFFLNASLMLNPQGQVHATHKNKYPYCLWDLDMLAAQSSLQLITQVKFNPQDYPYYQNKRGAGRQSANSFYLGSCSTFMYGLR